MKKTNYFYRWISSLLIFCHVFMLTGCFTTKNVYEDKVVSGGDYTFASSSIISHRNNFGVLYYTIEPLYINLNTGEHLNFHDLEPEERIRYNVMTHRTFPFSTYSDAVAYRDTHSSPEIFTLESSTKRELVGRERRYSPIRTGLAIGIPISVLLTGIL